MIVNHTNANNVSPQVADTVSKKIFKFTNELGLS